MYKRQEYAFANSQRLQGRLAELGIAYVHRLDLAPSNATPVSYTHLRAHETVLDLVCRLLLEKKKEKRKKLDRLIRQQE